MIQEGNERDLIIRSLLSEADIAPRSFGYKYKQ